MKFFKPLSLPNRVSIGLLILRIVVGLAFMFHGYGKIQAPFCWMGSGADVPCVLQAAAAVAEFVGGLAWIMGFITPIASIGLVCTMTVATLLHIAVLKDPFVAHGGSSYEFASVYLCVSILLLLSGPGRFSLDELIFHKKK